MHNIVSQLIINPEFCSEQTNRKYFLNEYNSGFKISLSKKEIEDLHGILIDDTIPLNSLIDSSILFIISNKVSLEDPYEYIFWKKEDILNTWKTKFNKEMTALELEQFILNAPFLIELFDDEHRSIDFVIDRHLEPICIG